MKKINFSLLFFVILISNINNYAIAQVSGWFEQTEPYVYDLYDVKFLDENTGLTVGNNGEILKTTNSGNNWILINSGTSKKLKSISILNPTNIFITGDSGVVLKSTNFGDSWTLINIGVLNNLNYIVFNSSGIGFIAGSNGTLLRTTNSGLNWISTFSDTSVSFNSISFVNERFIWATGQTNFFQYTGIMVKTIDLGLNWTYVNPGSTGQSIVFVDSLNGYCGFCTSLLDLGVLKTVDGGLNWECTYKGFHHPNSLFFLNESWGICVGEYTFSIQITTDSGLNWNESYPQVPFQVFKSAFFINSLTGWVVGNRIIKTTNGGGLLTNVIQNSENIPTEFSLQQNYPNPFNPTTKIRFDIPKSSDVKLTVYNSTGEKTETLIDENIQAGSYETDFDGSKYPSGIYFYRLETNGFIISRKMILLK